MIEALLLLAGIITGAAMTLAVLYLSDKKHKDAAAMQHHVDAISYIDIGVTSEKENPTGETVDNTES
jgi:hypothetical protein